MATIGVPIKVLHEAEGHVVTVETTTGEVRAVVHITFSMYYFSSYCFVLCFCINSPPPVRKIILFLPRDASSQLFLTCWTK